MAPGEGEIYQTHKIGAGDNVVPFQNIYDELGRVKQKRVGGKLGVSIGIPLSEASSSNLGGVVLPPSGSPSESSFLQKVNYSYNIRGWLTGVNDVSNLQQLDQPKSLFAMKLSYNKLDNDTIKGVKKLFNGNIAEQIWRTAKADKTKRYGYAYDGFDRLKKATFQLPGTTQPISNAYNESLSYDSNGNILKLERFGKKQVNQGIELDDLTYTYEGNMLKKIVDATNNADGFKQGTHTGDDYTYDTFGNLKTDKNKGITNIKYNHLNLPVEITFGNGKIEYIYSSGGAKVQKKVTQGTAVTTTDYLGGFQYTNNVLEFFPTPEGYYDARNSRYVYQYADHLGNTRLSYSDINKNDIVEANEILSEADYYPFGLQHTENSIATTANKAAEKYQYNAKEFQDELNLNVFDYGARNYDATIGRWFNHDPLSEVTLDPYGYTYNNPINLIDPTGMAADGWRINNETQEKEFNEDYKEDNTPKGYTYADIIIDKKEGKVYDQSGGITETSFVDDITVIKYSGLNPYYNAKPSGKYGSYVPDAMSLGYGANVGGLIFSASFNVSVVANHEDIALVLGGNFEFGLAVRRPGFGTGGTMGFHDNYGGNKDVLRGLAGYDSGWAVNAGIIGMSRSQSAYDNGKINPDIGVRSTTFTYGPGIGGGYVRSTSESFKLSNGIRNIKSMYNKWNF